MDNEFYTSNNSFSLVAHAAAQRSALLEQIDKEDRDFNAAERDQMDIWGEAIAFCPAHDQADRRAKMGLVRECLDLLDDDVGDETTVGKLIAALHGAHPIVARHIIP